MSSELIYRGPGDQSVRGVGYQLVPDSYESLEAGDKPLFPSDPVTHVATLSMPKGGVGRRILRGVCYLGSAAASLVKTICKIAYATIRFLVYELLLGAMFWKDAKWRKTTKYDLLRNGIIAGLKDVLRERDYGFVGRLIAEVATSSRIAAPSKRDLSEDEFKQQMCEYHLKRALRALHASEGSSRDNYKSFISCFRLALNTDYYLENRDNKEDSLIAVLHGLSFSMYTKVDMQQFSNDLVEGIASPQSSDVSSGESHLHDFRASLDSLRPIYTQIQHAGRDKKIMLGRQIVQSVVGGAPGCNFDPVMQGNPPYKNFEVSRKDRDSVVNVRMSTPTHHGVITPEFKAYLRALKAQGKKHFYVNLQQNNNPISGETVRSLAIQALAEDPEFKDTFIVVTLDKDSAFYRQTGKFAKQKGVEQFKQTFITRMFDEPSSGFYIPESLKGHRGAIEGKLDLIHQRFFGGRSELSVEERQYFIEIAYTMFTDYFVTSTNVDYYNASCKDCIDRGGGANALMFFTLTLMQLGRAEDFDPSTFREHIDSFAGVMFAPALWARKRSIIKERMEKAVDTAMFMSRVFEEDRSTLEWFQAEMSFSGATIHLDSE